MAAAAVSSEECPRTRDVLILYGKDAGEWCQYLQSLFHSYQDLQTYLVESGTPVPPEKMELFKNSRCIIVLLSCELVQVFQIPAVLQSLQEVLQPPHKVVKLFCGVAGCEDYQDFFKDWPQWKQLTYDDDPEAYIVTVMKAISEGDSGCDSVTDAETEDAKEGSNSCNMLTRRQHGTSGVKTGNLIAVQPNRIRCGVQITVYIILKCKLDNRVKMEVEFSPANGQSVRVLSRMENEYTVSVCTPDLPPGRVGLRLYAGDLMVAEADISYYTDMEEISNLLASAANPVEFMCQALEQLSQEVARRGRSSKSKDRSHSETESHSASSSPDSASPSRKRKKESKHSMRRRSQSDSSSDSSSAANVWVVGHNIVFWAGKYAEETGWGRDLGLSGQVRITWMGQQGMLWDSLISVVSEAAFQQGPPQAIIIQLGENDLPAQKGLQLSQRIKNDLTTLVHRLPGTTLFWSGLLERREWQGAVAPEKVNRARQKACKAVCQHVRELGGRCILHPEIYAPHAALYQPDGVNLSEWGMDTWLHSLRQALCDWLQDCRALAGSGLVQS